MPETIPFNTLAYTQRLKRSEISVEHAEAHAEALTDFLQDNIATSRDLKDTEVRLTSVVEKKGLQLTIVLGSMMAAGIGLLAIVIKLF